MSDSGGSDRPPDSSGGKGRQEEEKSGMESGGKSQTTDSNIGESGSRSVRNPSQQEKGGGSEATYKPDDSGGRSTPTDSSKRTKNKNEFCQMDKEQTTNAGKRYGSFIKQQGEEVSKSFTDDPTRQKIRTYSAVKPEEQKTTASNIPESDLNKNDPRAKPALNKQASFRTEPKAQNVEVSIKPDADDLHEEQRQDESICNGITVTVETPDKRTLRLDVLPSYVVKTIIDMLKEKRKILPEKQMLAFKDTKLEDHHTLAEYNIKDGSYLYIVMRDGKGPDKKDLGNREALSDDGYKPIPKKRNLPKTPPSDYRKSEKDKNDQSVVRKGSPTLEEHKSKTEPTIDVGGIAAKGAVPETGKGDSDEEGERKFQNVFDDSTEKPVTFKQPLLDQTVEAGQTVLMYCIASKPNMVATWTKDEEPVEGSDRVVFESDDTKHSLHIFNTVLEDAGTYVVKVGDEESTSSLKVKDSGTQAALSESGSFEVLTSAITEEESQMEDTRYSSIDPPIRPMLEETKPKHVISYTDNCKSQKEKDLMSPGAEVYQHTSTSVAQNSGMSEPEKNETLKYELKKINGRFFLKKGSEKKVLPEKFDHAKEVSLNDDDLIFADRKCYRITEKDGCLVLVDIDEVPCIERQTQPPINADTVPTSSLLQKFPTSEKCKPNSDIHSDSEMKSEIEIQKPSKDKDGRNVWNNSAKGNTPCERKCGINSTSIEETQTEVDELTKKLASININEEQRQEQKQDGKMHEISAKVIAQGNVKCYPIMCKLEAKLRWMYLACKPERFTEVMNKVEIPDLELRLEKETLLVILHKRVEEKRVLDILQEIYKQIVHATTDLTVNKYNLAEIEAEQILNELKLSKLVSNGSMFVTRSQRENSLIFVCHSELLDEAYKECSAAVERFCTCNTETVEYPVRFEMVIGHNKIQDVIENAFPQLKILYKVDDKKQKCECKLTGDVTCFEKAKLFLKEKIFDKYTANSITLKTVKNLEMLQKAAPEAFQSYLEMKIQHIIHAEKLEKPKDVFFKVGNREIIIGGSVQQDIDSVVQKVTNCVAHKEVKLDGSNTIQEKLVSKIVSQNKENIFSIQTEGKLHFVGSPDIVHRAASEYTEKASTRQQQSQPWARTVEVDDTGVYYFLKSIYQRDTYLTDIKGVTIVPVEKDNRSGFVIHSTDEDNMIKAEQRLKSMIANVKEETMTLKIQNGRSDKVDDLIKVVEQDFKVKIIRRKAIVPNKEAQSTTDGKDNIPSSKQRTWKFPGNHAVKITNGKAEHSWHDLLVEFLASSSKQEERKKKIDIIPQDSGKKKALLNIPLKDEGGKDKHRVSDVVKEMLVESKKEDCIHISLALVNRGCWPLKVFLKRLLEPIFAHLKEDLLPVTVEICIEREEEFFECSEIAQKSMPRSAKEEMQDMLSKDSAIVPVKVIKGNLTDMEAEVYVNPSSPTLTFDGAVSKSILDKAGPDLKKECEKKYRNGIADWGIGVTHGFNLPCHVVFHGALKQCSGTHSLKSMKDFVIHCLELAKRLGKQSIAFPLIGTGGLSYNVQDVADIMFAAVRFFAQKYGTQTCLKRVLFVAYTKDFSGFKVMRDKEEAEKKEIMQALQQKHQFQGLQVNVGRFKLKVQEGSLSSFVDEDGIIYLWDRALWTQVPGSTHVLLKEAGKDIERQFFLHRDGPERQKLFSTTGGKLGVKNIIHVPSENKAENLFMSLRGGLKMADENQLAHVAVFLDKKSPFLCHKEKISTSIVDAFKDLEGICKHVTHVTIIVEDRTYLQLLQNPFSIYQDNHTKVSKGSQYSVQLRLLGEGADILAAKKRMQSWDEKNVKHSTHTYEFHEEGAVGGMHTTEPESMSMDRTEYDNKLRRSILARKSNEIFEDRPDLHRFVLIENIPTNSSHESLNEQLNKAGPTYKLIYSRGDTEALLMCNSVEDARCWCRTKQVGPLLLTAYDRKALGPLRCSFESQFIETLKKEKEYISFYNELESLCVLLIKTEGETFDAICQTSYQMKCVLDIKNKYLASKPDEITFNVDSFEHIEIPLQGVTEIVWNVFTSIMADEVENFEKHGTVSFNKETGTVTFQRFSSVNDETFNKLHEHFKKTLEKLLSMDCDTISIDEKDVHSVPSWIKEINGTKGTNCIFNDKERTVIIYGKSYEDVKQTKHLFDVKSGKIKTTGRRRRALKEEDDYGQSSLEPQSDYEVVPKSVLKRADFFWERDAKIVETFKTDEDIEVYVYVADILKLPVDCIVNAANETLQHGGGVAAVIARNAGPDLTREGDKLIQKKGNIPVGAVVSTTAGVLRYRGVLHAVGPRWSDYWPYTDEKVECCEQDLYHAIFNSFVEAERHGWKSIALPAISSAIFGVPVDLCVCQYVKATVAYSRKSTENSLKEIHFIDRKHDIIKSIQKEFKTVLKFHYKSPYQRQLFVKQRSHRYGFPQQQSHKVNSENRKETESSCVAGSAESLMEKVEPVLHKTESGKHVFYLSSNSSLKLTVYEGDILAVKNAAIVVTIDGHRGHAGFIARNVTREMLTKDEYKKVLVEQLKGKQFTGKIVVTKGFGSGFVDIIHVIFPKNERYQGPTERRKHMDEAYRNILSFALKKNIKIVATTLIGIDKDKAEDVDLGANAFFDALIRIFKEEPSDSNSSLDVHLVCKENRLFQKISSIYENFVLQQQETRKGNYAESAKAEEVKYADQQLEDCVICMDQIKCPKKLRCGHMFCTECIDTQFEFKRSCPTCGAVCGIITGDQPDGNMDVKFNKWNHCAGYSNCGQISITYTFPSGYQSQNHPDPGKWYKGLTRTAYLPDNTEGRKVLDMLDVAFKRRLVFTIGRSRTTGQEGVITWNDIHHKTDPRPNTQFGYPDPTYLIRVKDELAAKGITEDDIKKIHAT